MKKIINGKKFDTETADLLGVAEKDFGTFSFYKKKNGKIFSIFDPKCHSCYGDDVEWVTDEEEMKDDLEEFLSVEEYEKIFGEVSE